MYSNPTNARHILQYYQNNWPSQSSLCSTNNYCYYNNYASSSNSKKSLCRKGLLFDNNCNNYASNTHGVLFEEKIGVPVFVEEKGDGVGEGEGEEPIYYDCDFFAKNYNVDRSFDVRGLTIKEEVYGEI